MSHESNIFNTYSWRCGCGVKTGVHAVLEALIALSSHGSWRQISCAS